MSREATLFDDCDGSVLEAYFILSREGGNIPPAWLERSSESRKKREAEVARVLNEGAWGDIAVLRDWEEAYRKECFYYGIRVLMELERKHKSAL